MVISREQKEFVYFIKATNNLIKIGVTKNVESRLKSLQTGSPGKLELIGSIETAKAYELESELHEKYRELRVSGEWFNIGLSEVSKEIECRNTTTLEDFNVNPLMLREGGALELGRSVNRYSSINEDRHSFIGWDQGVYRIYLESWERDSHVVVHMVVKQDGVKGYLVYALEHLHGSGWVRVEATNVIPNHWKMIYEGVFKEDSN